MSSRIVGLGSESGKKSEAMVIIELPVTSFESI